VPGALPKLWTSEIEPMQFGEIAAYFDGRTAPTVQEGVLADAVSKAIQLGLLWAPTPARSYLHELLPADVIASTLELLAPPPALTPQELLPDAMPAAWDDNLSNVGKMWSLAGAARGYTIPWVMIADAVMAGLKQRLWEVSTESIWPCGSDNAEQAILTLGIADRVKEGPTPPGSPPPSDTITAGGAVNALELSKVADTLSELTAEAPALTFSYEVFITAKGDGAEEAAGKLNEVLAKATSKIKF